MMDDVQSNRFALGKNGENHLSCIEFAASGGKCLAALQLINLISLILSELQWEVPKTLV